MIVCAFLVVLFVPVLCVTCLFVRCSCLCVRVVELFGCLSGALFVRLRAGSFVVVCVQVWSFVCVVDCLIARLRIC